jgi:hypothetical protein
MISHYCFFGNVCIIRVDSLFEENVKYYVGAVHAKNISEQIKWVEKNGTALPNVLGDEFLNKGYLLFYS